MKKAKQLLIDLTPLLDIILIILFLVLVSGSEQSKKVMQAQKNEFSQLETHLLEQIAERDTEISDLKTQREDLLADLKIARDLSDFSDAESRAIDVMLNEAAIFILEIPAGYPQAKLELTLNNQSTIVKPEDQTVEDFLRTQLRSQNSAIKLLMLQYPGNQILWRDYSKIKQDIERVLATQDEVLFAEENLR